MNSIFKKGEMLFLLEKQLSNFFILSATEVKILHDLFSVVEERVIHCFSEIDNKYFLNDRRIFFSPYHSGQYLIYLYYFSNSCSSVNTELADKLYYLNKILHSCDIYHEVKLPKSFFLEHPVGTVLGRATYGNNFFAMQNCTIGGNKGVYPSIGNNVTLYSGAKILGNSRIGNNVTLSANTYVKDTDILDGMTVFGSFPNLIVKYL